MLCLVNAAESGSVRNKQNNGGLRIGQEYMRSTIYAWLISQPLMKQSVNDILLFHVMIVGLDSQNDNAPINSTFSFHLILK